MRKLFSILSTLLILLSGMQFTISMHFCGGEIAESKVSVWGDVAGCGMEESVDQCTLPGSHVDTDCCNNQVAVFAIHDSYAPSFSEFRILPHNTLQVFDIPSNITLHSINTLYSINTSFSPPGHFRASAVSLSEICVFRI